MSTLVIVPIFIPPRALETSHLPPALEQVFALETRIRSPWFDAELAFDDSRGQYNSTALLRELLDNEEDCERILGLTSVDLFTPILTFVFGEAQLDGRAAVVSTHRLNPEVYGLPADEIVVVDRLEKEAVHELGHTFGLVHCADPYCVMHASTYVEEIDLKSSEFCPACRPTVRAGVA